MNRLGSTETSGARIIQQHTDRLPSWNPNDKVVKFKIFKSLLFMTAIFFLPGVSKASLVDNCQVSTFAGLQPPDGAAAIAITSATAASTDLFGEAVNHCIVYGTVDYAGQGNLITFKVRLPTDQGAWNQKMWFGGGINFSGNVEYEGAMGLPFSLHGQQFLSPLARGYATVTTDTGHNDPTTVDASWAITSPGVPATERRINYSYRGIHLSALAAKEVMQRFYGQSPKYSYFCGRSNGGREGIVSAAMYPSDFNGIIAGSPAIFGTGPNNGDAALLTYWLTLTKVQRALNTNITPGKAQLITQTVLRKCDALDGVVDNLVSNQEACHFYPVFDLPICAPGVNNDSCFSISELLFLSVFYNGVTPLGYANFPGFIAGGENLSGIDPFEVYPALSSDYINYGLLIPDNNADTTGLSDQMLAYFIFNNPAFDVYNLGNTSAYYNYIDSNTPRQFTKDAASFVALAFPPQTANLSAFKKAGGKMLLYNGWYDGLLPPQNTVNYYLKMANAVGGSQALDSFMRLYMVPAMAHEWGLHGPQLIDGVSVIENWVEHGKRPEAITAATLTTLDPVLSSILGQDVWNGMGVPTPPLPIHFRPLCPYPKVDQIINPYGDIWDANNFKCKY